MPTNIPASTPRKAIAAGTPEAKREVPGGNSRRRPSTMATSPTAAPAAPSTLMFSPRLATPATPTGGSSAYPIRRRSIRPSPVDAAQLAQRRQHQYPAERYERREPAKHPAPGQLFGDPARQHRADQTGDDPGTGQRGEDPGAYLIGIDLAHHHVHGGDQQPDRQPLHEPGGYQYPHRSGRAADQQPAMNSSSPTSSGRRAPWTSEYIPDTTMPTTLATRKPVKAQP